MKLESVKNSGTQYSSAQLRVNRQLRELSYNISNLEEFVQSQEITRDSVWYDLVENLWDQWLNLRENVKYYFEDGNEEALEPEEVAEKTSELINEFWGVITEAEQEAERRFGSYIDQERVA